MAGYNPPSLASMIASIREMRSKYNNTTHLPNIEYLEKIVDELKEQKTDQQQKYLLGVLICMYERAYNAYWFRSAENSSFFNLLKNALGITPENKLTISVKYARLIDAYNGSQKNDPLLPYIVERANALLVNNYASIAHLLKTLPSRALIEKHFVSHVPEKYNSWFFEAKQNQLYQFLKILNEICQDENEKNADKSNSSLQPARQVFEGAIISCLIKYETRFWLHYPLYEKLKAISNIKHTTERNNAKQKLPKVAAADCYLKNVLSSKEQIQEWEKRGLTDAKQFLIDMSMQFSDHNTVLTAAKKLGLSSVPATEWAISGINTMSSAAAALTFVYTAQYLATAGFYGNVAAYFANPGVATFFCVSYPIVTKIGGYGAGLLEAAAVRKIMEYGYIPQVTKAVTKVTGEEEVKEIPPTVEERAFIDAILISPACICPEELRQRFEMCFGSAMPAQDAKVLIETNLTEAIKGLKDEDIKQQDFTAETHGVDLTKAVMETSTYSPRPR